MAMIGGLFLGGAACDIQLPSISPPFFTSSNADAPYQIGTTMLGPDSMGITQKYMYPGLMNQGAIDPESEFCMYAALWGNTPLSVFDGDSQMYRAINGDSTKAAAVALRYIDFRPKTKDATDLSARFINRDSDFPALCIDMTDVTTNKSQAGTIFEFTISPVTDGGTTAWKAGSKSMVGYRKLYVREGTGNDSVGPEITDLGFARGDTLDVSPDLTMCFDEAVGAFHAGLVNPQPGDTPDVIIPLLTVGPDDNVHGQGYTLVYNVDLEYGTKYYLILAQSSADFDPSGNWGLVAPLMPYTQDLNGNALDGDSTGMFTTGDFNEVLGGSTTNMIVKYTYFFTEAPPP